MPNTHRRRRRYSIVELSRVGVGGVYLALGAKHLVRVLRVTGADLPVTLRL